MEELKLSPHYKGITKLFDVFVSFKAVQITPNPTYTMEEISLYGGHKFKIRKYTYPNFPTLEYTHFEIIYNKYQNIGVFWDTVIDNKLVLNFLRDEYDKLVLDKIQF